MYGFTFSNNVMTSVSSLLHEFKMIVVSTLERMDHVRGCLNFPCFKHLKNCNSKLKSKWRMKFKLIFRKIMCFIFINYNFLVQRCYSILKSITLLKQTHKIVNKGDMQCTTRDFEESMGANWVSLYRRKNPPEFDGRMVHLC